MNKLFFSIIIPALNEAKYLPHLLEDLSQQSFRDFEVIVVDGHSDDKTVELTNSFTTKLPSLTVLNSEKRHVCTQRNLGAESAQGQVLIFSDADNRLPSYFLQGIKYRLETTGADLISPYLQPDINNTNNDAISTAINLFLEAQVNIKPTFLLESLIVITKKGYKQIGGFDEAIDYAEGKNFIQNAHFLGLVIKVIKDPVYTFSFRRLRKYGAINIVSRAARLELANLFDLDNSKKYAAKLYPMLGGAVFAKNKKKQNRFIKNVKQIFKDF